MINMLKRLAILCALLAATGVLVAIFVTNRPAGTQPRSFAPPTGFGGYQVKSPVQQLSAEWRVPVISASSPSGAASTWIGVQSPSVKSFVQVGTTEDSASGVVTYQGFWSDAAVSYHAQSLLTVHAGDLVQVSIVRQGRRWSVGFVDWTELARRMLLIKSATVSSTLAEWVQEDPTTTAAATADAPYPVMTAPVFTNLLLNRLRPTLPYIDGQVLSTENGTFLVPSRVRNDGFAFITPQGAVRQYLIDAFHFNTQYFRIVVDLSRWSELDPASRRGALSKLVRAYSVSRSSLIGQYWPARARSDVAAMAQRVNVCIQAIRRAPLDDHRVSAAMVETCDAVHAAANKLRASLGLPRAD
jgi:hypothetical protein